VVAAWFAILFTGRYPRGLFDFVLGVLRWWNRPSHAKSADSSSAPTRRLEAQLSAKGRSPHSQNTQSIRTAIGRLPAVSEERRTTRVFLMGRAGLEPATLGLKVPCSTS
jgi:hypothetical protein